MSMQLDVALVREQGVTFAVVVVKRYVLDSPQDQDAMRATLAPHLGWGVPIVFMAQDSSGTPTYVGRRDIVNFLANVFVEQLPWRTMTLSRAA